MVRCKSIREGAGVAGALVAFMVAGCGGGSHAPKPSATPSKPGGAVYQPGDVSFGVLAPTSGAQAQRGQDLVDGAKAAIAEINIRGGVNGHKAALVTYDDGCDAKKARAAAVAVKGSEAAGALGGICTSAASAAARTLGEELPFLVTSANSPGIVSARRTPTAFLTNGTPYQAALATSHWLVFQRAQRLAVVTADDRPSQYLGDQLVKLTSPVPKTVAQEVAGSDWAANAQAALKGKPDVVYWAGSATGATELFAALKEAGFDGKFVASAESETADFAAKADGAYVIAPASPQYLPGAKAWTKAFQARFKRAPGFDALQAYEGVRALAQAVTQSGKVDRTRNSRELAVLASPYKTLIGDETMAFSTDHTVKYDNNIALKVQGGKFVIDNALRSGVEG